MKYFLAILMLLSSTSILAESKISYVKDSVSGQQVKLENLDGQTRVTNVKTGESIVVTGELAGVLTDKQYTKMLQRERYLKRLLNERNQNEAALVPQAATAGTSCVFSYSVSGGTGGYYTPLCYFSSTSVGSSISATVGGTSTSSKTLSITLYRDISFWPDTPYGTKSFTLYKGNNNVYPSWSSLKANAYYYLYITTPYDGRSVWGTANIYQN